jgi:hypothetical protein
MSQIEVNTSINSVNVANTTNTVDVNQDVSNILVIPQIVTEIVEVVTPGPQGPKGDPGDPYLLTGSFVTTSSFYAFTSSYNTGSFTGSFKGNGSGLTGVISSSYAVFATTASFAQDFNPTATASFAITASYAISASQAVNSKTSSFQTNIAFDEGYIPYFNSNNSLSSSTIHQWTTESIAINAEFGTGNNPEALFVFQPNPDSINIITAESDIDNYSQLNVFNRNSGSTASSDIVATADNGNEFTNFIDMGINSSTFTGSVGGPNDAYLYSTGNDLTIGNATANKHIRFFTGGGLVDVYQKLVLNPDDLHEMTGSLDIEGALIVTDGITGSLFGTSSYAVTASYALNVPATASFAVSASYAVSASQAINSKTSSFQTNIQFAEGYIPVFDSNSSLSSSIIHQWTTESIVINAEEGTGNSPEALYVFQPNPDSVNVISSVGDADNYIHTNVFNRNSGSTASADVVATADNGNEFINFIDMGINSSTFTGSVGGPNDAYLYSTGNDLTIGNATANKKIRFFTGGGLVPVYQKLILSPDNLHELTGSLNITNTLTVTNGITGSLFGTASFAVSASYAANVPNTASFAVSASQAITASFAINASQANSAISASYANISTSASYANIATSSSYALSSSFATAAATASYFVTSSVTSASYADNALSASYAATSSFASDFTVAGTLTAQTINVQVITSSVDYVTGSTIFGSQLSNTHQFTGSVTITGSLAVNDSNVILTNQTSSMTVLSSSYAISASFALSSSYALSASQATNANTAVTASYILNAVSASFATTASYALTAESSSFALTASFIDGGSY